MLSRNPDFAAMIADGEGEARSLRLRRDEAIARLATRLLLRLWSACQVLRLWSACQAARSAPLGQVQAEAELGALPPLFPLTPVRGGLPVRRPSPSAAPTPLPRGEGFLLPRNGLN